MINFISYYNFLGWQYCLKISGKVSVIENLDLEVTERQLSSLLQDVSVPGK